jgi:dephospho-CoA kinase
MARDGLTQAEAQARIDAQMPQAAKAALATWVIENNSDLATLATRVQHVIGEIETRFGRIGR